MDIGGLIGGAVSHVVNMKNAADVIESLAKTGKVPTPKVKPVGSAKEINTIPPKGAYVSYGKNADPIFNSEDKEVYGPEYWLIEKLFVPEEYRGTGVGSAMVKNAIHEMIKEDPSKPIRLSADPFGENAMSHQELADWYKKLGFDEETYTDGMSGVPMRYYGKDPGLQNIPKPDTIGNFDMTNPDIYKALFAVPLGGAMLGAMNSNQGGQ